MLDCLCVIQQKLKTQQRGSSFSLIINLCVNNLSHLSFGLVGAQARFFLLNIFVSKKRYERISEYIRIKKTIQTNIRIYLYKKMIWTIIRIYSYRYYTNMIQTKICIRKYLIIEIYLYKVIFQFEPFNLDFSLKSKKDTNEYPNIFVS